MRFRRYHRVAAALGVCALVACAKPAPPVLRLGFIRLVDEAAHDPGDIPAQRGAQLAVEELNAAGGVNIGGVRHRVLLTERQVEPRADAVAAAVRSLISVDAVDAIIAPQASTLAVAASAVAESASVPLIAPMASSPAVTEGRQFTTRLALVDASRGEVLARFAYDSLKLRRAAALFDVASNAARERVRQFSSSFALVGGAVTDSVPVDVDRSSALPGTMQHVLAEHPEAILLVDALSTDALLHRLREMGYTGRVLGIDGGDASELQERPALDGVIVVGNFDPREARPALAAFSARWRQRYPNDGLRATAAATYDAVKIVADAAMAAGTTVGSELATAIRAPRTFDGALATYRFNGSGDPTRGAVLLEGRADSTILRATVTAAR